MDIAQGFGLFLQSVAHAVGTLDLTRIWESRTTALVIGWLLGVLSTPLVEWVKDRRRRVQIRVALRRELEELNYRLVLASFTTEDEFGEGFNRAFITRTKELIKGYRGANHDPQMVAKIDKYLAMKDDEIATYVASQKAKDTHKAIPAFEAPYVDSAMSDLRLLNPDLQSRILDVRARLGMLNSLIADATYYNRLTFTSMSDENHAVAVANSRMVLRLIGRMARIAAEKIHALSVDLA